MHSGKMVYKDYNNILLAISKYRNINMPKHVYYAFINTSKKPAYYFKSKIFIDNNNFGDAIKVSNSFNNLRDDIVWSPPLNISILDRLIKLDCFW